ncbi:MAG: gamma carbonic anhydrase family protein [Chloroflexota bacterium]
MIRSVNGKTPVVAPTAFVSEVAYVIGDVEIGEGSSVWPGTVIRGDTGPIRIGKNVNIQDNSVLHVDDAQEIGDGVTVGHCCVIHCRSIGAHSLIGNNATVLEDVEIGEHCIIGANSVVPAGTKVPSGTVMMGVPAQVKGSVNEKHKAMIARVERNYMARAKMFKEAGL